MGKKILTVVGARPQFIKAAPVSSALSEAGFCEILVHTGQHYDASMSSVFFKDLHLPSPHHLLDVGSGSHAVQTGEMMQKLENVMSGEKPDLVLVYGDTNSTIAGALVAAKLNIPLAHVEAGLRSFNRSMPEEINRVVTDRLSEFLFAPSKVAMENLASEGLASNSYLVGDVMLDALMQFTECAEKSSTALSSIGVAKGPYYLSTVHRASNTDSFPVLRCILTGLSQLDMPVIFPLHPRTKKTLTDNRMSTLRYTNIRFVEPASYLDMIVLMKNARAILTDSGGVQKEAFWLKVPCVTLRDETEWVETVETGWNTLVGTNSELIRESIVNLRIPSSYSFPYGDGNARKNICAILQEKMQ